tara:strand:+ start:2576 stop:4162 length:1587 start_codon:yes stop_codon:yes gene_type:complete
MPDPTNLTSLKKSPFFRLKGLKDRNVYPNDRTTPENCAEISNMNFSESGIAASRNGKTKYNSSQTAGNKPMTGFIEAPFKAGSKRFFGTETKLYADDGTTRSDVTGSVTVSGSSDEHFSFAFIDDKIVGCNTKNPPFTWAGNTGVNAAALTFASDSTSWTKAEGIVVHKNTLIVLAPTISSTVYPTRILWADVNTKTYTVDITRYLNNNRFEVGGLNSTPIVGGVDNWDKLWVMKSDGVYVGELVVRDAGAIEYVPDKEIGALKGFSPIAPSSFIARPDFVFGIAKEGAFVINKEGQFQIITSDIDFHSKFNVSRLQYAVATTRENDHQVRVLMSGSDCSAGHDKILVWDWQTGDISIEDHSKLKLNYISKYSSNNEEKDIHGGYSTGYLYTANTDYDDDGSLIDWSYKTSVNDLTLSGVDKTIHSIVTFYKNLGSGSQSLLMEFERDEGARASKSKQVSLGGGNSYNSGATFDTGAEYSGQGTRQLRWGVNRTAQNVSIRWSGSSIVQLIGYQIYYTVDDTEINTSA